MIVDPQIITWLLSLVAICVAIYTGTSTSKRACKSDTETFVKEAERKAAEMATINVKLDDIGKDTKDIKYDVTTVKEIQQEQAKDLVKVTASVKSAHHRLDFIEKKLNIEIPREFNESEEAK